MIAAVLIAILAMFTVESRVDHDGRQAVPDVADTRLGAPFGRTFGR